ncbi:MAG: hypothetical protein ACYDCM_07240 [Candidatus Acidiferrales bacterium]
MKRENAASQQKAFAIRTGAILQDTMAAFRKFPDGCDIMVNRRTGQLEPVRVGEETYFDFSQTKQNEGGRK